MNLDRVIIAMDINGVSEVIINKADVLREVEAYTFIYDNDTHTFNNINSFKNFVQGILHENCNRPATITWSETPNGI